MSSKTYIDAKGYRRFKDSNKLVHRWAAAKKAGRPIPKGKVVHHKDGNKRNNDPRNLQEMSRSGHSSLHSRQRRRDSRGRGGMIKQILRFLGSR